MIARRFVGVTVLASAGFASHIAAGGTIKVEGYLEFKKAPYLVVDAQRIEVTDKTKVKAGYDYRKAPDLWRKFAAKYGDRDKISNFFFGDHSLSTKRAADLEKEIARNYSNPQKDPPTHAATR